MKLSISIPIYIISLIRRKHMEIRIDRTVYEIEPYHSMWALRINGKLTATSNGIEALLMYIGSLAKKIELLN